MNSSDLSEIVRCEIIVKKCLPVLTNGLGCGQVWLADVYKLHIAYRKIFRYIFKLSLRAHLTELLNVFGIDSVENILNRKWTRMMCDCIIDVNNVNFKNK